MCFEYDSHPPIAPIAGGAVASRTLTLEAADGNRFAAFQADAAAPSGAGMVVLPDVRGLHRYYEELTLRFAEAGIDAIAIDYFGRSAGVGTRAEGFDFMSHVERTTWPGLLADIRAAAEQLRRDRGIRGLCSVGFCFGGRLSFDLATIPDLAMSGVVGFYGWPVGPGRGGVPAPADHAAEMRAAVLGLFGGADRGITPDVVAAFETALTSAGVTHTIVTYDGAPHSFFDRSFEEHADASADAWQRVLAFVRGVAPAS
jgi:carboxymethylenebutenolidase